MDVIPRVLRALEDGLKLGASKIPKDTLTDDLSFVAFLLRTAATGHVEIVEDDNLGEEHLR
jgi:hypothetical protein